MLRRLLAIAALVVGAALVPAEALAQNPPTALVEALPGEINLAGESTADDGRTDEVTVVLAPAESVGLRTDGISAAFWSPTAQLPVLRVNAHDTGADAVTIAAGETRRMTVRFTVPPGYDPRMMAGSLRWSYVPLHPVADAAPSPLAPLPQAIPSPAPITTATPAPRRTMRSGPAAHPDLVSSRCRAASGEASGLTRTEVFDLGACLTKAGHDSPALHVLRGLAHQIGARYGGGVERATFVQTWLTIAQLDGKRGLLNDAEHAARIARDNASGSGLEAQARGSSAHYATLAAAARATPPPAARPASADAGGTTLERIMGRSSGSRAPPSVGAAGPMQDFESDTAAQRHCPRDTVVWLNTNSGIYHYAGMRWYGNTNYGAYVCEREAVAAGNRATENGQ